MVSKKSVVALIVAGLWLAGPANAYIGPGAGLSAIGTLVAVVGAFLLLIVGFVWYPVKRLLRARKTAPALEDERDEGRN